MMIFMRAGFKPALLLFLLLTLVCCSEKGELFDPGLINRPDNERTPVREFFFVKDFKSVSHLLPNGTSQYLIAGNNKGIEVRTLMKFSPVDTNSVSFFNSGESIKSAKILLNFNEQNPFDITTLEFFNALTHWSEDSLLNTQEVNSGELLSTPQGVIGTVPYVRQFELPLTVINEWIGSPDSNFGIVISASDTLSIKGFSSKEASTGKPALYVTAVDSTGQSRIMVLKPLEDTFQVIVTDTTIFQNAADSLVVANGMIYRALLSFDLGKIPKGSTINMAQMTLKTNSNRSYTFNAGFGLEFYQATASHWQGDFGDVDGGTEKAGTISDLFNSQDELYDSLNVNVRVPVQNWVNGKRDIDLGFLLKTTNERGDVSRIFLRAGKNETPELEVIYTPPPSARH